MIIVKDFLSIGLPIITLTAFIVTVKNNGIRNKEVIEKNEEYTNEKFDDVQNDFKDVNEKLKKKNERINVLEEEKIKFTEALNRTYIPYEDAYRIFIQEKDYEKDMKLLNKSIEEGIKANTNSNDKTHEYLIKLLNQK
jgi:hypothetical protein